MKRQTIKMAILTIAFAISGAHVFAQTSNQDSVDKAKLQQYFVKYNIQVDTDPLGIYFTVSKMGNGKEAVDNSVVKIKCKQRVFSEKMKIAKAFPNLKKEKARSFKVGDNKVISGLDDGVRYFPRGTKVTLYIPSTLAYGATKHGNIPPNSILVYDVEILN